MKPLQTLTLPMPDDWHLHVREGKTLQTVMPFTEAHFARAIVMPNLVPPVVTHQQAAAYRTQILAACSQARSFEPFMTLYLTEKTDPDNVKEGFQKGIVTATKFYPAGATTHSEAGVKRLEAVYPVLEIMEEMGMPLLVHGEVTDPAVDIFDREAVFLERILEPATERFPKLKIVLEHVTTQDGVDFVRAKPQMAATVTPHHLVINRNAMFQGGIRPHFYCLPVAKRERHRQALVKAVVSGDSRFFLGTDSAPHLDSQKETACGCAGIFNTPVCLAILAHVFEEAGALKKLEGFVSRHGAAFYGKKINARPLTLVKEETPQTWAEKIPVDGESITIFDPGFPLHWRVLAESPACS